MTNYREFPNETVEECRRRNIGDAIAAACLSAMFVFILFFGVYAVGYKNGVKAALIENEEPIYHIGPMPVETSVFAVYNNGGIITQETAKKLTDGRILPISIYSNMTFYDLMPEPIGWTEIPDGLMEVLK